MRINSPSAEILMQTYVGNNNDAKLKKFNKQFFNRAFLGVMVGLRFRW